MTKYITQFIIVLLIFIINSSIDAQTQKFSKYYSTINSINKKDSLDLENSQAFRQFIAPNLDSGKSRQYLDQYEALTNIDTIYINDKTYFLFENDIIMGKNEYEANILYKNYLHYSIKDTNYINKKYEPLDLYDKYYYQSKSFNDYPFVYLKAIPRSGNSSYQ